MRYLKGHLLLILLLLLGGISCKDKKTDSILGPNAKDSGPSVPDGGVGFGVSGLLFNNNLILYDRARSNLSENNIVLIPQMYFTNIEEKEFPTYGEFPRDQIISGGVKIDDIAAITDPIMVAPDAISYVRDTELVVGLSINGDIRAYPHNLLWWHEIINDQIGGLQVSVTFCPLTGTGLVFDTGTPSDRLTMLPSMEMTWARWKQLYPDTKVAAGTENSRQTNLGLSNYPYGNYRSDNTAPLFSLNRSLDARFPPKRMVHGILINDFQKAYPFSNFPSKAAVNDQFEGMDILVVFDQKSQLALSYDRKVNGQLLTFSVFDDDNDDTLFMLKDNETGTTWTIEGRAIEGELSGQSLTRIQNAYNAFWFAWAAFWPTTDVYTP